MALFEVRSPIKIPSSLRSVIVQLLTLDVYSSGFIYFTWSQWIYKCIKILPTILVGSMLLIWCLELDAYMKIELFLWCSVLIEFLVIDAGVNQNCKINEYNYLTALKLWQKWQDITDSKLVDLMMIKN